MEIDGNEQSSENNTQSNASWKNDKTGYAGHRKQNPVGSGDEMYDATLDIQCAFSVQLLMPTKTFSFCE